MGREVEAFKADERFSVTMGDGEMARWRDARKEDQGQGQDWTRRVERMRGLEYVAAAPCSVWMQAVQGLSEGRSWRDTLSSSLSTRYYTGITRSIITTSQQEHAPAFRASEDNSPRAYQSARMGSRLMTPTFTDER